MHDGSADGSRRWFYGAVAGARSAWRDFTAATLALRDAEAADLVAFLGASRQPGRDPSRYSSRPWADGDDVVRGCRLRLVALRLPRCREPARAPAVDRRAPGQRAGA
jgi:hypothetical protein